jgi:hypothetical protein
MTILGGGGLHTVPQSARPDALAAGGPVVQQPKSLRAAATPRANKHRPEAAAWKRPHPDADPVFDAVVAKPDKRRHSIAPDVTVRHEGRHANQRQIFNSGPHSRNILLFRSTLHVAVHDDAIQRRGIRPRLGSAPLTVGGVEGALGLLPPTAKASKTRTFRPPKGGLGVLGVKIDRYVGGDLALKLRKVKAPGSAGLPPAGLPRRSVQLNCTNVYNITDLCRPCWDSRLRPWQTPGVGRGKRDLQQRFRPLRFASMPRSAPPADRIPLLPCFRSERRAPVDARTRAETRPVRRLAKFSLFFNGLTGTNGGNRENLPSKSPKQSA